MLTHQISDVELGIGIIKYVLSVQVDGFSMLKKHASQFQTNASLMTKLETVLLASMVTILRKDNASSQNQIMPSQLIQDAVFGTGTTKSVLSVQTTGPLTPTKFVSPSLINANLMTKLETVLLVITVMILRKDNASSQNQIMPSPLIQDAVFGIGTTKFA